MIRVLAARFRLWQPRAHYVPRHSYSYDDDGYGVLLADDNGEPLADLFAAPRDTMPGWQEGPRT